jgi:hypothetical protein
MAKRPEASARRGVGAGDIVAGGGLGEGAACLGGELLPSASTSRWRSVSISPLRR